VVHKIEPKYRDRVIQLEHLHPPAFRFLTRLQDEGPAHGLWISTAANAHVYKHSAYLMYIKLQGSRKHPTSITLSPRYNMIEQNTVDRSELLFPRTIEQLVMGQKGFSAGWAPKGKRVEGEVELQPSTPDRFFDALFDMLRSTDVQT